MRNLSVHYHVWCFENLIFLTTNRLSLWIDCSARCVIRSCFYLLYICSVHVQQFGATLSFHSEPNTSK